MLFLPWLPQNPCPGLSDRQCSFKTQKHIDSYSDYSCPLSDLYSKATLCCPLLRFFPTEGNKAGPHCIAFGVRGEKGSPVWNKEGKTSPLRGHLRGAPFALSWAVGCKNGRQSRRGKHHAGGRFVPNVFMKDSLIKGGKNVCWFPISFLLQPPPQVSDLAPYKQAPCVLPTTPLTKHTCVCCWR